MRDVALPPVCITLVNYNGWRDTLACVESLRRLDYPTFRILVVDNGSADDSRARLHGLGRGVELICTGENLGFARAQNIATRRAMDQGAGYVWMLNNDTTVAPDSLAAMLRVAQSNERVGAVGSLIHDMFEPSRVQAWGGGRLNWLTGRVRHTRRPIPIRSLTYLTGASLLVDRQALDATGLLDERFFMYWEDVDFCLRLRRCGWELAVAPDARIWHKESASAGKGTPFLDYHFNLSAARFFRKHLTLHWVPTALGFGGRISKRLLRGQGERARAICRAFRDA